MRDLGARLERLEQRERLRSGSTSSVVLRTALVALLKLGSRDTSRPSGYRLTLADLSNEERAAITAVRARAIAGDDDEDVTFIASLLTRKFFDDDGRARSARTDSEAPV